MKKLILFSLVLVSAAQASFQSSSSDVLKGQVLPTGGTHAGGTPPVTNTPPQQPVSGETAVPVSPANGLIGRTPSPCPPSSASTGPSSLY